MTSCLLCGHFAAQPVESTGLFSCSWCVPKAKELHPEAVKALQDIDNIPPAFALWSQGRREESGLHAQRNAALPVQQPAEIVPSSAPGLFVGDLDDVKNVARLLELGIGFVLNLCPERLEGHYADVPIRLAEAGIKQLTWPAQDSRDFDIVSHVVKQGACDFIEVGLRSAGVLVNCWGGVNRSASVALAFLIMKKKIGLVDAVRSTMSQRGTVLTNRTFRLLLVQLALETGCPLRSAQDSVVAVTSRPTSNQDSSKVEGHSQDWPCTDPQRMHRGKRHRDTTKYGYLYASQSACIKCIKYYIQCEKIDPGSKSDSQGYSAIDFAKWELGRAKNDEEAAKYRIVLSYLQSIEGQ